MYRSRFDKKTIHIMLLTDIQIRKAKSKMISFGVYGQISLADARRKRDEAKRQFSDGIDPSDARKSEKITQKYAAGNTFKAVAMEWHSSKCSTWSKGYASEILRCFENDVFPFTRNKVLNHVKFTTPHPPAQFGS
nr:MULTISPECIES: integrase arm-type DNA-binding domain-containing protein [unclassified Providencia]